MKKQLALVQTFCQKFDIPVPDKPTLIPKDKSENRFRLMRDEVAEYQAGAQDEDVENIAKELADILYVTLGTMLEHGLQDKMEAIFEEVHRSNMSKGYHAYKMVKGPDYVEADMKQFFPASEASL